MADQGEPKKKLGLGLDLAAVKSVPSSPPAQPSPSFASHSTTLVVRVNAPLLGIKEKLKFLSSLKIGRAVELIRRDVCEPVGHVGDDWDLYITSTGVWMNRDRTLISYAPLADEDVLEFKKRPDAIAFQKAKVYVAATKAVEEVPYLGGETRVKGLIQSVVNKNPSALAGCAIYAKVGGDWEATSLDEQAFISSIDFTEEHPRFELKGTEPDAFLALTPRSRDVAQKERDVRDRAEASALASAVNAGATTPRGSRILPSLGSLTNIIPGIHKEGSKGSTTPRGSQKGEAPLTPRSSLSGSGGAAPTTSASSDKEALTPRGSMRDKKGSRISVGLSGAFDPLKSLGHSVTDQFGGQRPDNEFVVIFVEDERNFAPYKFDGTLTVAEIVRRLCAMKPAKHTTPADYSLWRTAHSKWLKDRKPLGHYHINEQEEIELKRKDETSPEVLEALGEAAAKMKAELKAKRKKEKEERRKKKEEDKKVKEDFEIARRESQKKLSKTPSVATLAPPNIPTEPGPPLRLSVVSTCMQWLCSHRASSTVGIFRISGSSGNVRAIFKSFAKDPVDLSQVKDVHEVAEAVKQYLREAPEPLVTNLPAFEQAFGQTDEAVKVAGFKAGIAALTEERRKMLSTIVAYLHCIHLRASFNKMQASNLGVVFGPNLYGIQDALDMNAVLRKNAITTSLIERADSLFHDSVVEFKAEEAKVDALATSLPTSAAVPTSSSTDQTSVAAPAAAPSSASPSSSPSSSSHPQHSHSSNSHHHASGSVMIVAPEVGHQQHTSSGGSAPVSPGSPKIPLGDTVPTDVKQQVSGKKVRQVGMQQRKGESKATSKTHIFRPLATWEEALSFLKYHHVHNCTVVFDDSTSLAFAEGKYYSFDKFDEVDP